MSEFLPEHRILNTRIQPNQQAQVTFQVPNPGEIDLKSATVLLANTVGRLSGPQRLELFKPGSTAPLLSQTSNNGPIHATFTVAQGDAGLSGNWTARVTNLSAKMEAARLEVVFPGTLPVQTSTFPASAIDTLVELVLRQISIHITRGTNQSFISFPEALNIPDRKFTIEDVEIGPLREYPNDINSESITLDLVNAASKAPNGSLRLTIRFESAGREVRGAFDVEMDNMQLVVTLGLTMFGTSVSYNSVDVDFSADIDVKRVPDKVADALLKYKRKIKDGVEGAVTGALSDFVTCQRISAALTSTLTTLTGENSFLADARITNNELVLAFFRPAGG